MTTNCWRISVPISLTVSPTLITFQWYWTMEDEVDVSSIGQWRMKLVSVVLGNGG